MPTRPDYEVPIGAAIDFALKQPDIDADRLALWGVSMGGYYATRAAAFDRRIKALIVHGVLYDMWQAQSATKPALARLAHWKSPQRVETALRVAARFNTELRWSVANAMWVFGVLSHYELLKAIQHITLEGIAGNVRCQTLILHGEKDHFIPREQVDMLYNALNAPKTLRVFTEEEGAAEHCQIGNMTLLHQVAFDWLGEVFGNAER
jgi:dienelactone hydrolase